jgi:hypothetical protein
MRVDSVPHQLGNNKPTAKTGEAHTAPPLSDDAVYFDPEENRKKREQQERESSPNREQSQHALSQQELSVTKQIEVLDDSGSTSSLAATSADKAEKPRALDVLA